MTDHAGFSETWLESDDFKVGAPTRFVPFYERGF